MKSPQITDDQILVNGWKLNQPHILKEYLTLTKPTVSLLVVITAVPSMLLAEQKIPDPKLAIVTLLGIFLASASGAAFNQLIEPKVDSTMSRTQGRPLPLGKISPLKAMLFAFFLGVIAIAILYYFATPLASFVAFSAIAFYVLGYTMVLKRRTVQNIVIGGAAGAVGPLIGWAAVSGNLGLPAWALFLLIFLWTPPHFWALSLRYKEDYEKAKIPMLPVVLGEEVTRKNIFFYSLTLIPTASLSYFFGAAGVLYFLTSLLLSVYFAWSAYKLYCDHNNRRALAVFHVSCMYLFLIFAVLTVDRLLVLLA